MRTWRKLESSIITSDRLSRVSDSAKWLFTLLLVAQDDEGKYPWTKPRIQALIATTDWDSVVYESLLSELRFVGVADLRDGFVHLRNGAEKNGTPANSKNYPLLYPPIAELGTESATSRERVVNDSDSIVKSRVEIRDKSRDKNKMQKRAKPALRQLLAQELLDLFDESENLVIAQRFPGIDLAWVAGKCVEWHNARGGSGNWKLAFKNWLDNEKGSNNGTSRQNAQTNTSPVYVDPSTRPPSSTKFADLARRHAANRDSLSGRAESEFAEQSSPGP